jgi:plasmid stability protein
MNTFTLHALDSTLANQLKARAKSEKKSLNRTAKELLSSALGINPAKQQSRHHEFAALSGVWTEKEAKQFDLSVAGFSETSLSGTE